MLLWLLPYIAVSQSSNRRHAPALFIVRYHKAVNLSTVVPRSVYTKLVLYFLALTLGWHHGIINY